MRKLLVLPFILMFMLTMCTEEVIKLVKEIQHDTITVEKFIDRTFMGVDTVEVYSVIREFDTVLVATIDSIFVYTEVHDTVYIPGQTDTVWLIKYVHVYHDTLVKFESERDIEYYDIYLDIVIEFHQLSAQYGWDQGLNGNCIITMWTADEAPPASRSSFSYLVYGQWVLKLKESLTHDQAYGPLMREMARRALEKRYDPEGSGTLMDPSLSPDAILFSDSPEKKKVYLDKLFEGNPI